jgi:protein-disulfide isomerase
MEHPRLEGLLCPLVPLARILTPPAVFISLGFALEFSFGFDASFVVREEVGLSRREICRWVVVSLGVLSVILLPALGLRAAPQAAVGIPDVDSRVAFGSKNAPVVMEVFSDFQCPACKTLYMTTNRQLMDNYVTTGKVYLIHRDFPLPMHAHSRVAAQYSRAAAQIGKFEPVEQALFQNQERWQQTGDVDGTVASVLSAAEMTKVRALVKAGTIDLLIQKDVMLGNTYKVSQTPTTIFHAKGQTYPYAGGMSYDILRNFLDQLISQR